MNEVKLSEVQAAVERRNVDHVNGEYRLANGKDVTEENVNAMLYGPYATHRLEEHNKWYARAEALADDAPIADVRAATWGDSRAVTKQGLLRVLDAITADRKQYEADVLLALRYVQQEQEQDITKFNQRQHNIMESGWDNDEAARIEAQYPELNEDDFGNAALNVEDCVWRDNMDGQTVMELYAGSCEGISMEKERS